MKVAIKNESSHDSFHFFNRLFTGYDNRLFRSELPTYFRTFALWERIN